MKFVSPTYGVFNNVNAVTLKIIERIKESPHSEWTIAIGTDSQNKGRHTKFCSAVLLLEKGKGGIYFYSTHYASRLQGLQHRMLKEAETSIAIGHKLIETFEDIYLNGNVEYDVNLEIHCDLGKNGESQTAVNAAIGWITAEFGNKVTTKIKPDSPAASYVADRYTK